MTVVGIMQHMLVMLVAAAASVLGTHLINTLRDNCHNIPNACVCIK